MLLSSDQEKFENTKKRGYQMSENQRTDNNTTTKKTRHLAKSPVTSHVKETD